MIDVKFSMFFDRDNVVKKIKDGTKSTLSKFGAFVRRTAKTSIRKAPKKYTPTPGKPPRSHVGTLRDLIFFGYDSSTESVVVGPQLFKRQTPTAPNLLEKGGSAVVGGKPVTYRAFPFMQPALDKEAPKFAGLFTGAIKN